MFRKALGGRDAGMELSDNESDSYSLLEAPRPSLQGRMLQAISDGRLPQMVLEKQAGLSPAIALSLEVLGLGTSSPEEQVAAGKALSTLCTHVKLRPAVDNLLVLRRLCRVIELTDSATALRAAAEALFAIADDAAWQSKGGQVSEVLREALSRCVDSLAAVAKSLNGSVELKPASPSSGKPAEEAHVKQERTELATAAAEMIKTSVLHLLTTKQLVDAAHALGACLAAGISTPQVLSALAAVLQQGSESERAATAAAAVEGGAVPALVRAVAAGVDTLLAETSKDAAASSQPSASAEVALSCLHDVLLNCVARSPGQGVAASAVSQALAADAVKALVPLLKRRPQCHAVAALKMLLVLASCGGLEDCSTATAQLVSLLSGSDSKLATAALEATDSYLAPSNAEVAQPNAGPASDLCIAALLRVLVRWLATGGLTVFMLLQQAENAVHVAVERLLLVGETSGSAALAIDADRAAVTSASAELAVSLLTSAAKQKASSDWLEATPLAMSLVKCMGSSWSNFEKLGPSGIKLLTLALQLVEPDKLWEGEELKTASPLIKQLNDRLNGKELTPDLVQLAAVALLSLFSARGRNEASVKTEILGMACTILSKAVTGLPPDGQEPTPQQQHLALLGGTLNAVIACICPDRALRGPDSLPLRPSLPDTLLGSYGSGGPSKVIKLYTSADTVQRGVVPNIKLQLQWHFEAPPAAVPMATLFQTYAQHSRGYGYDYSEQRQAAHTPIAATTAEPLLQAVGAATQQVTQLAAQIVAEKTNKVGDGEADEAARTSAQEDAKLVGAALKVAGNAAAVLAMCVPPGVTPL